MRAALCNGLYTARLARAHNNANVVTIGARVVGVGLAEEIVDTFLATPFDGGRHARRVDMITALGGRVLNHRSVPEGQVGRDTRMGQAGNVAGSTSMSAILAT